MRKRKQKLGGDVECMRWTCVLWSRCNEFMGYAVNPEFGHESIGWVIVHFRGCVMNGDCGKDTMDGEIRGAWDGYYYDRNFLELRDTVEL